MMLHHGAKSDHSCIRCKLSINCTLKNRFPLHYHAKQISTSVVCETHLLMGLKNGQFNHQLIFMRIIIFLAGLVRSVFL